MSTLCSKCTDWDETDPKTRLGVIIKRGKQHELVLLRDKNRQVINNEHGTYNDSVQQKVVPKYEMESYFLFGVMTVKLLTGQVVEKYLEPFYYTNKKAVTHRDYMKQIQAEITNVKNDGSECLWVKKIPRENCKVWEEDDVMKLKG
eukprot:11906494-Ditylum_brightwellii.AAC.1